VKNNQKQSQSIPESGITFVSTLSHEERRLRWFFTILLTIAPVIAVIDKVAISILGPILKVEFRLNNQDFSYILNAFLMSYAVMYTVGGRLVDKFGERIIATLCVVWWSFACMLQSAAVSGISLGIFFFLLGIGEPIIYPAALRSTTRWFGKSERGFPISIWSIGSSIGNLLAPPTVAFVTLFFGWRVTFIILGILGLIWAGVWWFFYRSPARTPEEVEITSQSSMPEQKKETVPLLDLLKNKKVRAIVSARLVSDPVWYFYTFWTPIYLVDKWGYNLKEIGFYAWIPFLFGAMGGVFGGAFSDRLIRKGIIPIKARKRVLFTAGIFAPIGIAIGFAYTSAISLALIGVMAFIVYLWFINTAALVTDAFPQRIVGSVLGLMGTAGTIGGIVLNWTAGYILDHYHTYTPIFIIAGSGHLLATLILFFFLKEDKHSSDSFQHQSNE
jgi:MFS transporter, ACS family, hexuronate transporter